MGTKETTEASTLVFDDYLNKYRELTKFQREYKKVLSTRLIQRSEQLHEKSLLKTIGSLRKERNDLRAQIWVADSTPHFREDEQCLRNIQCHVKCQEHLSEEIRTLKVTIANLEYQIGSADKEFYVLNRKTVPEMQHEVYVKRSRKKLHILENRLEIGVGRESKFTAMNRQLHEVIKMLLNERKQFNKIYTTMVQFLNVNNKYLGDLLDYASNAIESSIEIHEKIANVRRKMAKDNEQAKITAQSVKRNIVAAKLYNEFLNCKNNVVPTAPLQPMEFQRRQNFKRTHTHKIDLNNSVLEKILKLSNSQTVDEVIEKYNSQESFYYSYFCCANERSYHISFLQTAVDRLFTSVLKTKRKNQRKLFAQDKNLKDLEEKLRSHIQRNEELKVQLAGREKVLRELFDGIQTICTECQADVTPLMAMLGKQSNLNIFNMRRFLKILEKRILNVVVCVYIKERKKPKPNFEYVVRGLEKIYEEPTSLHDIVLTQQCPECAEGELYYIDDNEEGTIAVTTLKETKEKLCEKVTQPEMQYRLHSISQCRLHRSRILAAKKHL